MKDPISINIRCQGCGKKKRKSVRYDGMFCYKESPLGDGSPSVDVEFDGIRQLLEDVDFSLCFIGGNKNYYDSYRVLCRACRHKVYTIQKEEDKKRKERILESLYTRGR